MYVATVRIALATIWATICLGWAAGAAAAAPPEPSGPHPRMLLDAKLRAAWQARGKDGRNPVVGAIAMCAGDHGRAAAQYMGSEWKKLLQACLVAWVATGEAEHAKTAMQYFTALIDDLDTIGDGKGGDEAGKRDSGYAIRNLAPYTALAYDWLHAAPGMTPALRARARQRWAAWLAWFDKSGYHPHEPASNYYAGYLIAATMVAIAQAGEAGEAGRALWNQVADRMWGKEMAEALAPGGPLDGGDWDEGWQYGPLSVAEYALGARLIAQHGVTVDGVPRWLSSVLRRHVHALNPSDRLWVGGDLDDDTAYPPASAMTLIAIAIGDAGPDDRRWARGELARLKLSDRESPLYAALATIGDPPVLVPRASWPTWYRAAGTATLFARTSWDDDAIWFVANCARTAALDHRSPNAGNFVLSRGSADLVVDPSPYGSLSTLTGNAPAVRSRQLPGPYQPSQGAWGSGVRWRWQTRTASGVVAARCDYSDAFRFQDKASDVPEALRDFVLIPSADGHDAQLVIADRARAAAGNPMYLRFRVPGSLTLDSAGAATAQIGHARLAIRSALRGPSPKLAKTPLKDCFQAGTERGNCDAARIPVMDYRLEIDGPDPRAVHVLDATGSASHATSQPVAGPGYAGVALGIRDAIVVWPTQPGPLTYRAPRRRSTTHVVLDAPASDGRATISARADADSCTVTIAPGGATPAAPLIVTLDEKCAVSPDPEASERIAAAASPASPAAASPSLASPSQTGSAAAPSPSATPSSEPRGSLRPRTGCCGAGGSPATPLAMALVILAPWRRRSRRAG